MAYENKIMTSLYGRRLGLQNLSTAQSGGSRGMIGLLVGPEALRARVTTDPTTSANLRAVGITLMTASSAGSSQVYTLDPPIPGVAVTLLNSTNATAFVKTGSVPILSSVGSTQTVIALPAAGVGIQLEGVTTALWLTRISTASGIGLTNTT